MSEVLFSETTFHNDPEQRSTLSCDPNYDCLLPADTVSARLGTAAAYSGPLIFSRLGLDVEKTLIPHQVALEQMRKGEGGMAAVVFITSKPVDTFVRGRFEPG